MRTTLIINDELLSAAKHRAAERNCSVSKIVNEALQSAFSENRIEAGSRRFVMPRFGGTSGVVDTSPSELANLALDDELKQVADAQHAAVAIEHACEWVSRDRDFSAFVPHGLKFESLEP